MAFVHGKNSYFALGSAGTETTTVDISSYLDSIDFPETVETADTTTFGKDSRTYIVGLKDTTISLSGNFDPTVDAQLAGALGNATALDFDYSPQGNNSGDVIYSGSAFITSYSLGDPVDDKITFSCDLQVTGDVTRSTVA